MFENKKELFTADGKKYYIDILRILACIMVMLNHTRGFVLEDKSIVASTFYCATFALCKIGVTIFLMITGALTLEKDYTYSKIAKNICRVAVPVFGLSLLLYIKNAGFSNFDPIAFLKRIVTEPYITPYWYIYALIGVYLALPFLQKMVRNFMERDYIVFIVLFLFLPPLLSSARTYLKFSTSSYFYSAFFPIILALLVCGNYIAKIRITKKLFWISVGSFVVSYALMFLSFYLPYLRSGKISYAMDSWNVFPVIVMAVSVFLIVRYLFDRSHHSIRVTKRLDAIAGTTFGIYLIHFIVKDILYSFGFMQAIFSIHTILGVLVLDVLLFIGCAAIVYLLKKIPIVRFFL